MTNEFVHNIKELIEQKASVLLQEKLGKMHPADIAELCNELSEEEAKIVRCVENEPLSFDQIKEITNFEANQLNSLLTILEIREIMKQLPGKMYTLVR